MRKIKNENDFLGYLISIKSDNNLCDINRVLDESGIDAFTIHIYLQSLSEQNLVQYLDTNTYIILPKGISSYMSHVDKLKSSFFNLSKSVLKFLIPYLLGIFSDDIYKFITGLFHIK